jgi:mannitol/fructose-specific phosphotransferase system IIA component (Ntr-type)/Kef-type K+ transport system membrane component KefB
LETEQAARAAEKLGGVLKDFLDVSIPLHMIAMGAVILGAYVMGRVFRRLRLSDVTGQMIGGALVGAPALHFMRILGDGMTPYDLVMGNFRFFVFVYLCLVAFGIGEELHLSNLRKVGGKALLIGAFHSALTFALVAGGLHWVGGLGFMESMLIGSIGITSAPAIAFVLMNQLRVEGHLRHLTASALVITDLIGIFIFSLLTQMAKRPGKAADASPGGGAVLANVATEIGLALLIGVGIFLLLKLLVNKEAAVFEELEPRHEKPRPLLQRILAAHPSPSAEILLITLGSVALGTGIAYYLHLPFLLSAVLAGFMVANLHSFAIFDSLKIDSITTVFNLAFFAMVGASMSLDAADKHTLWLAFIYIVLRSLGKMAGNWAACRLAGESPKVCRALPAQLMPQTGVAAVEAVFVGHTLGQPELAGIILIGIVFFGIFGVFQVERALARFRHDEEEEDVQLAPVQCGISEAARKLLGYLSPTAIILDLRGDKKNEIIERMAERAIRLSPQHIDREQARHMLLEREKLAPTGLGHGIAMPHCRLISLDQPVMVLGKHREGIVFGGVDDNPCNLILMFITSGRNPGEHLQIMAACAHFFANDAARGKILNARTPDDIIQVLVDYAEGEGHTVHSA